MICKVNKKLRKQIRSKLRIKCSNQNPRLIVNRTCKNFHAQLIDQNTGHIIISASSTTKGVVKDNKTNMAIKVGQLFAEKAKSLNISKISFDRHGYKFHGRVKAFAQTIRENGLKF